MTAAPPIVRTVAELRAAVAKARGDGLGVGLVPTMGSLHEGHLSLCRLAAQHTPFVVVSIFVNPTQFAPHEDLATYPRDEAADVAKLAATGAVKLVYAPTPAAMYPEGFATSIMPKGVAEGLETDFRPHFFAGVATVVAKLFTQVAPDVAVFGEKDYQQLQVIKQLVRDLDLPIAIVAGETLREPDGLALSSRNAYLDPRARAIAGRLNVIMRSTAASVAQGHDIGLSVKVGHDELRKAGFETVDYLEVRDAATLKPVTDRSRKMRILAAVRIGKTRLIDNMAV
ncbi:MAG: pantoate--beta-alanine ligase [Alphaproteobacteria bacterium]|nr:pantoate--beta-alanine ligase [Alphaproteobacteria bacterium]